MTRKQTAEEYIDELEQRIQDLEFERDDALRRAQEAEDAADPPRHIRDVARGYSPWVKP